MNIIEYTNFSDVMICAGTVVKAETFPKARNPSFKIWVNFGEKLGVLQSSAQITHHYTTEGLLGKRVLGCVNLGEKNIAGFISQFLVLGFSDADGNILLADCPKDVPNGSKLH